MRTLLNLVWFVFANPWLALGYMFAGVVCCLLVVTLPFGIAAFWIAWFALWPFRRTVVRRRDAGLGNMIWFVVAGGWLAPGHLVTGVPRCRAVIGVPLGLANIKLVPVSLTPLGRAAVRTGRPARLRGLLNRRSRSGDAPRARSAPLPVRP